MSTSLVIFFQLRTYLSMTNVRKMRETFSIIVLQRKRLIMIFFLELNSENTFIYKV